MSVVLRRRADFATFERLELGHDRRRSATPTLPTARTGEVSTHPLPTADAMASPFLTTAEAAAYCRYRSPSAIRNLVMAGRLRPDGRRGRAWLFKREALEAMLAGYGAPMAPGGM